MSDALYRTPSGKVGREVGRSVLRPDAEGARIWLDVPLHLPNDYGRTEPALFTRVAYHPADLTPIAEDAYHEPTRRRRGGRAARPRG